MNAVPKMEPVCKDIVVRCRREIAFEVFTARMNEWWPLETHSVGLTAARTVTVEPRLGGRLFETCDDGAQHTWGTVTHWDPPSGFDCTWHPGRGPDHATRLTLRFEADGDGTRVRLEHHGWELLGERAEQARLGYDSGWEQLFAGDYRAAADAAAG